MGTGEAGTPTKSVKTSTVQEQLSTPSYSDWAAAFQAYYGSGTAPPPPGFFSPTVASGPQPHPYLWGGQPLMPSYGTPPPHAALYSYNGIYAHPTMPPGAHPYGQYGMPSPGTEITMATTHASTETEVKSSGGKDRMSMKRSKGSLGSLGMSTGKARESAKAMLGSDADGHTQSRESGVEGSSEDSEDTTQNLTQKGSFEQLEMDGVVAHGSNMPSGDAYMSQGGHVVGNPVNQSVAVTQAAIIGRPAAGTGPTTNLNIGMDYWPGTTAAPVTTFKGKNNSPNIPTSVTQACQSTQHMASSHEGMPPDLWLQSQDDREVKRQRRKQSNRESARRSRLRKQAECEELNTKVDALSVENMALRTELNRLAEECKKLSSENASLLEQLQNLPGEEDTMGTQDREIIRHENQSTLSGRKTPDQNGKNYSNGNIWPRSNDKSKTGFDPTGKLPSCHNSTGYSDAVAAG